MSIYLTGDQHGSWDERERFIKSLSSEDILITLGDWGWDWSPLHLKWYLEENLRCMQLFIDGNHENFPILESFPVVEIFGGKAHKLADNIYHLMRGEMYEIEGKKFFTFGGALSIDKKWRTPYLSWWPQEQPNQGDYNHAIETLEKNNWTFDYLLTHTAETEFVQNALGKKDTIHDGTEDMIQSLKYEIRSNRGSFKAHYLGHLHEFYTEFADDYDVTCLYNQILNLDTKEIFYF